MSGERSAGRLLDAFLGKPGSAYQAPPEPENIPPLEEMLGALTKLGDRVYGRYAFSRDPLRGKFKPEEMDRLTVLSNQCGREYALEMTQKYGCGRPSWLAKELSLKVDYPVQPTDTSRVTFAQFAPPDRISIYRHSLDKADELLEREAVRQALGGLQVAEVLLAHELFHFVEEQNQKTIFTRTEKVELWAPWPLHNRSTIRCLGEIAGMSFARALTGLDYSPFVLDVFLVYGYSPAAAFRLYEEIMELAGSEEESGREDGTAEE